MNKKIASISLALLFASGAAYSQSSVTLYGIVDAGVSYNKGGKSAGRVVGLDSGQQSYSRLGFKGTEDLGNNMKGLFLLEHEIKIDTGATAGGSNSATVSDAFASQAYIGVSSNVGTVKLGRQLTPLYLTHKLIDPFANGFAAKMSNFFGTDEGYASTNTNNPAFSYYKHVSNAVTYETPGDLYGFSGSLQYGFGEQAGAFNKKSQLGASLSYANGPLTVAYTYYRTNFDAADAPLVATPGQPFSTNFIGAKYKINDMLTLHGAFDQNKQGDIYKAHDYMVGVTVPFGAHTVLGSYTQKKDKLVDNKGAKQYSIGYTYNFSKRTNLYAAYNHVANDSASLINTDTDGNKVNIVQLGLRHQF